MDNKENIQEPQQKRKKPRKTFLNSVDKIQEKINILYVSYNKKKSQLEAIQSQISENEKKLKTEKEKLASKSLIEFMEHVDEFQHKDELMKFLDEKKLTDIISLKK